MLKTISGLVRPTSGRVVFEGKRIDRLKPYRITRMGIVHCPEGRRLFANLSVRENLEMGAYARRDRRAVADDMERFSLIFPALRERWRQKAGTLSGGEQQMLAVVRALMARPRLLLLDEPSLGLAPILIEDIFRALPRIRDEGVTILIVEQNAHMALEIADTGYVLETGEVNAQARPPHCRSLPRRHLTPPFAGHVSRRESLKGDSILYPWFNCTPVKRRTSANKVYCPLLAMGFSPRGKTSSLAEARRRREGRHGKKVTGSRP
ncbi:MAG: ABC transporter ATP-binding protein [Planctomycetota bacterium]